MATTKTAERVAARTEERAEIQDVFTTKGRLPEMGVVETIKEAAEMAAERFGPDELEQHAQVIGEAWMMKLKKRNEQAKEFARRAKSLARSEELEIALPISGTAAAPYVWWNLLLAGPFQPLAAGGPFLPHKIIRAGEPAFMLAVMWRNPNGIDDNPLNPSAATVMAPLQYTLWCQTVNLTQVANGPDLGPINAAFGAGIFGFLNLHILPINFPPFPTPPEGTPNLYEMNLTVDITTPGQPYAGYSTWVLDPDNEPAFGQAFAVYWDPSIGWVSVPSLPGAANGLQHDIPARFLVHTVS